MGSNRFPGKMMEPLGAWPVIEWVLARSLQAQRADAVVLATSDKHGDDVLCDVATRLGVDVFRGDEADVLGRYAAAAKQSDASVVVRVCGDRPLVDPVLIDAAIDDFASGGADLTFNHTSDGAENWPKGFGAEVLSADLLYKMSDRVESPYHREHVTSFVWHDRDTYRVRPVSCPPEIDPGIADLKLDVDEPEDLERLRRLLPDASLSVGTPEVIRAWRATATDPDTA